MYRIGNYLHINIIKIAIVVSGFISLYSQAPSWLGGLGRELAFYPFAIGLAIWLAGIILCQEKVYIPRTHSFYAFAFLLVWLLLTGIANINNMLEAEFKGIDGARRFIIQYGTMVFYFLSALYIYNIFCKLALSKEKVLVLFENTIMLSAYIMGAYSLFEIASLLGMDYCREIVNIIDSFFRSDTVQGDIFSYFRIRSLTAEASYFGMYCGVIMPWLMLRAFDNTVSYKKGAFNIAFLVYYIVLIMFSFSRTAYFIVLIEFLIFSRSYRKQIINYWVSMRAKAKFLLIFALAVFIWAISSATLFDMDVLGVLLSFTNSSNNVYELSNIARIGSQLAGWYMFLDNPVFGVGYGQYPFYYADYVPSWAWISGEIQNWSRNVTGSIMTPSHGIYTRLLAEAGFIGLMAWGVILFSMVWEIKRSDLLSEKKMCYITSIVALVLFGFNTDAFRNFYYWIFLGLACFMNNNDFQSIGIGK